MSSSSNTVEVNEVTEEEKKTSRKKQKQKTKSGSTIDLHTTETVMKDNIESNSATAKPSVDTNGTINGGIENTVVPGARSPIIPADAMTNNEPKNSPKQAKKEKKKKKQKKDETMTNSLLPTEVEQKQPPPQLQVKLKAKNGQLIEKWFHLIDLRAREVEETFQLVRCHLEGSDHSARFPDKSTGLYPFKIVNDLLCIYYKLDPKVEYTVYGHPYHPQETWQSRPNILAEEVPPISKKQIVKQGKLWKLSSPFLRSRVWKEYYVKLKYGELQCYKSETADKPVKSVPLGNAKVAADNKTDRPSAFQIIGKAKVWKFAPSTYYERQDWIFWIQAVIKQYKEDDSDEEDQKEEENKGTKEGKHESEIHSRLPEKLELQNVDSNDSVFHQESAESHDSVIDKQESKSVESSSSSLYLPVCHMLMLYRYEYKE